ncbi:vacuolar protein-sorting-associated protein [Trifolium pratense]|uniref:Vacuolar protein-sorting-associated protein n=1 Tax=Trifolium pratense TaxID=57577 RepID=A0A2K3LCJ6_TRIPR|nr:vacuolar protein-sorting-associated protein [Trifolium pratense]
MIANDFHDEDKWLVEGIAAIQHNTLFMLRALDDNNLGDSLKYSAHMLYELRTSRLSPHKYYEMSFDELRRLEMFFKDESRHGVSIVDLYELVQHAGNILSGFYAISTTVLRLFLNGLEDEKDDPI